MAGYADRTNKNRQDRNTVGLKWPVCKGVKVRLTDISVKEARKVNEDGTVNMRVEATWKPYEWPVEHDATFNTLVFDKNRDLKTMYSLALNSKSKKIVQGMHDDLLTDLEDAGVDLNAIPAPGPGQNYADVDPGYTTLKKILSMVANADSAVKVELDLAMGQTAPPAGSPAGTKWIDDDNARRKIWMQTPFNKVVEMQPVVQPTVTHQPVATPAPVVEQPVVQAPVEQPAPAAIVQPVIQPTPAAATAPVSTTPPPPPPSMAGLGV